MSYPDVLSMARRLNEIGTAARSSRGLATVTRLSDEIAAMTRSSRLLTGTHDALASAVRPFAELEAATQPLRQLKAAMSTPEVIDATRAYRDLIASPSAEISELIRPTEHDRLQTLLVPNLDIDAIAHLNSRVQTIVADSHWARIRGELSRATDRLVADFRELHLLPLRAEALYDLEALPSLELYAHANLLGSLGYRTPTLPDEVGDEEQDEVGEEDQAAAAEISEEVQEELQESSRLNLEALLSDYDPHLFELWRGADEGLTNRFEAARKFCSLQRELLRQLLDKAAPNRAVQEWVTNPNHLSPRGKNVPTMAGRIAYVCERAELAEYSHFAISDAEAATEVWKLLNVGVKEVPCHLSPCQVRALRIRSNNLILMTLQLAIKASS